MWKLEDPRWWLIPIALWLIVGIAHLLGGSWQEAFNAFVMLVGLFCCLLYNIRLNEANAKLAEYEGKNDEAA